MYTRRVSLCVCVCVKRNSAASYMQFVKVGADNIVISMHVTDSNLCDYPASTTRREKRTTILLLLRRLIIILSLYYAVVAAAIGFVRRNVLHVRWRFGFSGKAVARGKNRPGTSVGATRKVRRSSRSPTKLGIYQPHYTHWVVSR